MSSVFLNGKRIYLRPLENSDLNGNYVSWLNDEKVNNYNSHHIFPYTLVAAREYIKKSHIDKSILVLAIVLKRGEKHIGNISLQRIDYVNRSAELAILVGEKKYWGKGYSKEAVKLIISHGFNSIGLTRIYCGTSSRNLSMQSLALSLGMKQEGKRRKAIFKNGQYDDILEYGLLTAEFKDK